jgi:hypothetical protein
VYSSDRPGSNGAVFRVCFADSELVVPDVDRSGSIAMKRETQLRKTERQDDQDADQSLKSA